MTKLIISDLDGTILFGDKPKQFQKTVNLIKSLTEKGIKFAIASGRTYHELRHIMKDAADDIYFVSYDGALITYKDEVLFKSPISKETAIEFCKKFTDTDYCVGGRSISYVHAVSERFERNVKKQYRNHSVAIDCPGEIRDDILKISLYNVPHKRKISSCETLDRIYYDRYWDEYVLSGINKKTALDFLKSHLGISSDECMAFGDNTNDIEMLKSVSHSYAMTNAKPIVKSICNNITDSVYNTLENIFIKTDWEVE